MDQNESESLVALEYLMEEFFSPTTSNDRKHEIEAQLTTFKSLPQSWKICLYFLTNTSSHYVTMFALSTLESVINQQWTHIEWRDKEHLKSLLYTYLIEKGDTAPHFIRNKYAKLLTLIAKHDWPLNYPNFMHNILELLKTAPSQLTGLALLRTASEELMGGGASLENGRRQEVARLLHSYTPHVFELLYGIVEGLGTRPRHTATATPPPSPTHPTAPPALQLANATFKLDAKCVNREALETVQQLFTWVPISQIPAAIIRSIFNFTNYSNYGQDDHDTCVLAMSTINELLYRKCTPPGSLDFFVELYYFTLELLRDVTCSTNQLDPVFIEKLCELLILLIEQHLWRLEAEPNFSALDFLSLLYQLTIQIPSVHCYLKCLSVWAAFFKQNKPNKSRKYLEAFLGLLSALVKKIQFSINRQQLADIDNTDPDDDNETDWHIFLKTTIEIIAMIAEHALIETLNQILVPWKVCYDVNRQIESRIDPPNCLNCDSLESDRLVDILTDFSSLTQALARLSPLFFDQNESDDTSLLIHSLIDKLLESASLATRLRFYQLKTPNYKLSKAFIDNHSQLMAALKTYLIWMTRNNKIPVENLETVISTTLPLLHDEVPCKIVISASHLFHTLSTLNCSPNMIVLNDISQFIQIAPNIEFLIRESEFVIYAAITNILIKQWPDASTENQNHRNYLLGAFFDSLTQSFRELSAASREDSTRHVALSVLPALTHIVDSSKELSNASKKRLFQSLQTTIEHSIVLFPLYAHSHQISSVILDFFLQVLRVLQAQLGVEGTKSAVQVFLDVAVKEESAGKFLDKLLQIFQLVIEAAGSSYKQFMGKILELCMDNVYPFILADCGERQEAFCALLTLLHSALAHRWQHFSSSRVQLGYSPVYADGGEEGPEPQQLMAVLQVFGQALLQPDIGIFKLSLASLEDLNAKWKLYANILLRFNNLSKYLTVLVQTLLEKGHSLLSEDIQVVVYNMAVIDFGFFFGTFLPSFLQTVEWLSDQQRESLLGSFMQNHDRDMPTFVQRLQIFINDAQHFRLCSPNRL